MGERQTHWREIDGRETDTLKRDRWEREGDVLSHLYPNVCVCVHMCVCVYICVSMSAYVCACVSACDGVYVCDCIMYTCAIASWLPADPDHIFCLSACVYFFWGEGGDQQAFWHHSWRFRKTWPPLAALLPRSMRMHQSCYVQQWVMLRLTMSPVTYNNQSHHTHQGAKSHISSIFFDTQMTKSFYTYM